jgi:predicted nuclease with RNAse H fold
MAKRYPDKVDLTVRIPKKLHLRATKVVRKLQDKGLLVDVPEVKGKVKPSIAALALKGLEREIEDLERKSKHSRAALKEARK